MSSSLNVSIQDPDIIIPIIFIILIAPTVFFCLQCRRQRRLRREQAAITAALLEAAGANATVSNGLVVSADIRGPYGAGVGGGIHIANTATAVTPTTTVNVDAVAFEQFLRSQQLLNQIQAQDQQEGYYAPPASVTGMMGGVGANHPLGAVGPLTAADAQFPHLVFSVGGGGRRRHDDDPEHVGVGLPVQYACDLPDGAGDGYGFDDNDENNKSTTSTALPPWMMTEEGAVAGKYLEEHSNPNFTKATMGGRPPTGSGSGGGGGVGGGSTSSSMRRQRTLSGITHTPSLVRVASSSSSSQQIQLRMEYGPSPPTAAAAGGGGGLPQTSVLMASSTTTAVMMSQHHNVHNASSTSYPSSCVIPIHSRQGSYAAAGGGRGASNPALPSSVPFHSPTSAHVPSLFVVPQQQHHHQQQSQRGVVVAVGSLQPYHPPPPPPHGGGVGGGRPPLLLRSPREIPPSAAGVHRQRSPSSVRFGASPTTPTTAIVGSPLLASPPVGFEPSRPPLPAVGGSGSGVVGGVVVTERHAAGIVSPRDDTPRHDDTIGSQVRSGSGREGRRRE